MKNVMLKSCTNLARIREILMVLITQTCDPFEKKKKKKKKKKIDLPDGHC